MHDKFVTKPKFTTFVISKKVEREGIEPSYYELQFPVIPKERPDFLLQKQKFYSPLLVATDLFFIVRFLALSPHRDI